MTIPNQIWVDAALATKSYRETEDDCVLPIGPFARQDAEAATVATAASAPLLSEDTIAERIVQDVDELRSRGYKVSVVCLPSLIAGNDTETTRVTLTRTFTGEEQ